VVAALGDGCGDASGNGSDGEPRVAAGCGDGCGSVSGGRRQRSATAAATACGDGSASARLRRACAPPPHQDLSLTL